jgi:hypothetical protein
MTDTTTAPSLLPLEWTRIQRSRPSKRLRRDENTTDNVVSIAPRDMSCRDANCNLRHYYGNGAAFAVSTEINQAIATAPSISTNRNSKQSWRGKVYFCLPDPDCEWFQGYFFPESSSLQQNSKSTKDVNDDSLYFGILGQVLEMDDCLQCDAGGYRHVSLQFTPFPKMAAVSQRISSFTIRPITWTGSDMMVLNTAETDTTDASSSSLNRLHMQATTVSTGEKAHGLVRRLFASLIARLCNSNSSSSSNTKVSTTVDGPTRSSSSSSSSSIATNTRTDQLDELDSVQLMPQVAVVTGTMQVEYTTPQRE